MTRPRTAHLPGDEILSEIADLLITQNQMLDDIRGRLPEPTVAGQPDPAPQPVEVSEPAPKRAPEPGVDVTDPNGGDEPVQVTETAKPTPPPHRPAKKTAAKRTR